MREHREGEQCCKGGKQTDVCVLVSLLMCLCRVLVVMQLQRWRMVTAVLLVDAAVARCWSVAHR
jgi:hypothetical protein